jgi:hypothetical protein
MTFMVCSANSSTSKLSSSVLIAVDDMDFSWLFHLIVDTANYGADTAHSAYGADTTHGANAHHGGSTSAAWEAVFW